MADEKKTYPMMPVASWQLLRRQLKKTIPDNLSDSYISSVMKMNLASAKTNVFPTLRQIGFIDQEEKVNQELAIKWRDDTTYPVLCEQIKKSIYPKELIDTVPDPKVDRETTKRWFAAETGSGEGAVGKMVAFYALLCDADPTKTIDIIKRPAEAKKQTAVKKPEQVTVANQILKNDAHEIKFTPAININIQVHISPDASSTQIDEIFASMAKHFSK